MLEPRVIRLLQEGDQLVFKDILGKHVINCQIWTNGNESIMEYIDQKNHLMITSEILRYC